MATYIAPATADQLLQTAQNEQLYQALINQLQKDFILANQQVKIPENCSPKQLKEQLHEIIFKLLSYKFAEYLNLLYIIDVPESEVKHLDGTDRVKLSEQITFLVLRRSWQKVWFKNNYNS